MSLSNIIQPNMKAVFYGRHSTDKQNMDTQLRSAYDFAEKYQCEIIKEYLDEAVSSRKKERRQLETLLKDAHEKKFDFIIIYAHSRLARIPEEHDVLRIAMSALGIHIVESSSETLYNYGDIVYSSIKDALAKYELDKLRKVTKDAISTLLGQGLWTGGRAPFGYKYHKKLRKTGKRDNTAEIMEFTKSVDISEEVSNAIQNGRFERIEDELILVDDIFSFYKQGYGFRQIAEMMPKASHRGKDWNHDLVKQVIINPFYAGYIAIRKRKTNAKNTLNKRDDWKMNKCPLIDPVITFSEWEECFQLYEKRKEKALPPNYFKTSFLVNNLLYCEACKQFFKGKDQRSKGYGCLVYVCSCKKEKGKRRIKADDIHLEVIQKMFQLQKKSNQEITDIIKEKIRVECENLEEKMKVISKALEREELKLFTINAKIQKLFLTNGDETLIKILSIGKEALTNSIGEKSNQITELQKTAQLLRDIDGDPRYIDEKIMDFNQFISLPDIRLRRMYLYFIESISVDAFGNLKFTFRMNLEK
ncbi:recombinase family protein [Bacillus sp. FJAT-49736]|uniref:recombinase family protein n=1 Tax=Bacillus sp. FJAT-49736 TaxID=2833582 RepID=UPI001BC9D9E8|nr:recombinase family protein [Bacillus sp. FJAT-49736]MBS4171821.1 recombinase family protein [Bacillus sp. FJAT-49736]